MKVVVGVEGNPNRCASFRVEAEELFADKDKGVVVLGAYPDSLLVFSIAKRFYRGIDYIIPKEGDLFQQMLMPERIVAVARCMESDIYDKKTGVAIAEEKLKAKLAKAVACRLGIFAREMKRTAEELAAVR